MANAIAVRPVPVTDANYTSTDATESVALWSGATTYNTGDEARSDTTHRIYRSAVDSNLNNDPTADDGSNWVDVGPTNAWAAFDGINGTKTRRTDSLQFVLDPDQRIDAIGMQGLQGITARVRINDGSTDQYDETYSLISVEGVTDWYSFFFEERVQTDSLVLPDLPPVAHPTITVDIDADGAEAAVGTLGIGQAIDIGGTEIGPTLDSRSYSVWEESPFGGVSITPRGFSRRIEARTVLPANRVDHVNNELLKLRDTAIFWSLGGDYSSLNVFGFYRRMTVAIAYHTHSLVSLQIEGTVEGTE